MTNWIIYINGNEEANVKKRLVAGILGVCTAGAIALSGCGANSNEVVATLYFGVPEAAATTEADATSGSVEVETEDLFTSTELANIDKEEVSLGLANFMIRYQQANYDTNYLSMFGKDMWSQDLYGTGSTFGDDVKDDIMSNIENMLILEHHMDEYNVKITEEDEAKFAEVAKEFMDSNKRKAIKQMGATEEYIEEMLRLYTINDRMYDAIVADVDTDVKDSEISQKTITLVQVDKNSTTDDDGNETEYSEDEKKQVKADFEKFAKDAKKDLDAAVEEAGYSTLSASYHNADDTDILYDKAVYEAADKLKEGKVSDVIETDEYYYIVRLDKEYDKEATDEKKESIISERKSTKYSEVMDGYTSEVTWDVDEDVLAKITFDEFFTTQEETTESDGESDTTESDTTSDATEADQ